MKYKITIRKCADKDRASQIANEIARWSGSSADVVFKVITEKPVCIKREAEEDEAHKIKEQFERCGAEVELVPLGATGAPVMQSFTRVGMPAVGAKVKASASSGDDDDDDAPGRILDDREFADIMKKREDIFEMDTGRRLRNLEIVSIVLGIAAGFWLSTMELVNVATDFYEKLPEERTAKFVTQADLPKTLQEQKKEEKKKEEDIKTSDSKKLKPNKSKGANGNTGGGGDPRARVTAKGVLGIISGQIKGKTVASADLFGKGGFATGIDAIISGVGGLKSGGGGGSGRRGVAGIGYGAGYGSGFGGSGSGGVDDLIGNLMGGDGGGGLDLKKRGSLQISAPDFMKGAALTGGRSKASIMRVVMQNLAALRYAYNKRLREKPGLKGKITVKWAIDEFGKVIFCQVVESTMDDSEMETIVVDKIKRWVFDKIDKPGDVTEVVYPFVFSQ
jgi:hypothetical protein